MLCGSEKRDLMHMYMYMKIHVCSTLAKLTAEEENKADPTHHTLTVQTCKQKMHIIPVIPALRTGTVG